MKLATLKPSRPRLRESVSIDSGSRIDRESGVIRDVRILGAESRNGRRYTEEAMRDAVGLYEGADVHIDHRLSEKDPQRGLWEAFGVLRNIRYVEADKSLRGDLHYLKTHEATDKILERIERWPDTIGLSHEAYGDSRRDGDVVVVDRITEVRSVDLVRDPATNKSLFEERRAMRVKLRKILEGCSGVDARAKRLLEADDVMDLPVMDSEYEMDGEMPSSSDVEAALAAMITSLLSDKSLDKAALMTKVEAIIDAVIDEPAAPEEPAAPASEAEGEPSMDEEPAQEMCKKESKVRKPSTAKLLEHKLAIRDAIDAAGFSVSQLGSDRVALLESQSDIKAVGLLLESWRAPATIHAGSIPAKPLVRPLRESTGSYDELRQQALSEAKRR